MTNRVWSNLMVPCRQPWVAGRPGPCRAHNDSPPMPQMVAAPLWPCTTGDPGKAVKAPNMPRAC